MTDQRKKVVIVDYGMGNLFSVKLACEFAGLNANITASVEEIEKADALILPGVGAFANAMDALRNLHLVEVIKDAAKLNKPFFGVCLGMQIMMEKGFEFGDHEGLGIFSGKVIRFEKPQGPRGEIKVPQVCWNSIYSASDSRSWDGSPLELVPENSHMYFVHSYYVVPEDKEIVLSNTTYGDIEFCSSIQKGNIFACQYHPERSGSLGIQVYKTFASLINDS